MIIKKLTLNNFKSHENTQINFNQGVTLILGENGAGKSTILEAVYFALFKKNTGNLDDLVRKSQSRQEEISKMKVSLEFIHKGITYEVTRIRKKSQNTSQLSKKENDKLIPIVTGDKNVTREIKNILEIDYESFLNAVYIRQGEITNLIDKKPAQRKEFITQLLNIKSLQTAYENMLDIIKVYEDKHNINKGKLSNYDKLKEDKETLEQNISHANKEIDELTKENETLDNQEEQLKDKLDMIKENKEKYNELLIKKETRKDDKAKLEQRLDNFTKQIQTITENEEEIKKIERKIKPLEQLKTVQEIKHEIDSDKKDSANIQKTITEIQENKEIITKTRKSYEEYNQLTKEKEDNENKLSQLKEDKIKLDNIAKEITKQQKDKDNLFKKINETSEKAQKLLGKSYKNPDEIQHAAQEKLKQKEHFITILQNQIKENEKKISSNNTTLKATRESLKELEKTKDICPICQSEISHEKHEQLSNKYNETITDKELENEDLVSANKNQKEKLEEHEKSRKDIESINIELLKEQYNEFKNLLDSLKILETKKPLIDDINNKIQNTEDKLKSTNALIKNLQKDYDSYGYATNRLSQLPKLDEKEKEKDDIDKEINDKINKINEIAKIVPITDNLSSKIKYLEDQEKEYHRLKGEVSHKEDVLKNKEDTYAEIQEETKELEDIERQIRQLDYSTQEDENINNKYTSVQENIKNIREKIVEEQTNLDKDKQQLTTTAKEIKELEQTEKEQTCLKDYIKTLEEIRETYSKNGVQKDLRNTVRPQIEKNTLQIFNEFDFDYQDIKLDEDYAITVKLKQETIQLDMLSGGEKIAIALALRLGIAKAISKNKTELLILDEPTIHLDSERRNHLIETIRKINFVPQMVVVTHDDEMESLSNNIIKITKTSGISSYEN